MIRGSVRFIIGDYLVSELLINLSLDFGSDLQFVGRSRRDKLPTSAQKVSKSGL